jgi:excisionase family DNA binding protein
MVWRSERRLQKIDSQDAAEYRTQLERCNEICNSQAQVYCPLSRGGDRNTAPADAATTLRHLGGARPSRDYVSPRHRGGEHYTHIVVELPKDASLPSIRGKGSSSVPFYLTVKQAAHQLGLNENTVYNWIAKRKLREEHGLVRLGRQCRIEARTLQSAITRGELASCS